MTKFDYNRKHTMKILKGENKMDTILENLETMPPTEQENSFENYRTELVTKIAFMIGVSDHSFSNTTYFDSKQLEKLRKNNDALTIRNLCILRNQLLKNYDRITAARANLVSFEQMEDMLDADSIRHLRSQDMETALVSTKGINNLFINVAYINQFILENIDRIKPLIPDWVKFEYIKSLFLMPNCYAGPKGNNLQSSGRAIVNRIHELRGSFLHNRTNYPFQMYLNWPKEFKEEDGNVLYNDAKFLKLLYAANGDIFTAQEYIIDAKKASKETVYNFVDQASQIAIFVDCENVNPYCFAATLLNLDQDNLQKIKNIVLYDDVNTSAAWDYLEHVIKLPITHKEITRVLENKSLVDIAMATGVCEEFYKENTESIILASSDSDFWGLITNLPDARFYVLNEKRCTSPTIIEKLDSYSISHCFMDTFAQDKVQQFKTTVLFNCLKNKIDDFNNFGTWEQFVIDELIDSLFEEARIVGAESQIRQEKKMFFNTYLKKGLIMKPTDVDGKLTLYLGINR